MRPSGCPDHDGLFHFTRVDSNGMTMQSRIASSRTLRLWACVLLLPFMMLTLLPAQVMPTRGSDGMMTLVLCTGDGPMEVTVDSGQSAPKVSQKCQWAAHANTALLATFDLPLRPMIHIRASTTHAAPVVGATHDPHGIMARGPPATI
jgi:hypothetical protein